MTVLMLLLACGSPEREDTTPSPLTGTESDESVVSESSGTGETAETEDSEDSAPPRDTADRDTPQWDCTNRFWYEGDLVMNTDAAVDAFCDTYNGVQGSLTLDLGLGSGDPVQWLDGVGCVCEVTSDLELFFFDADELTGGARHANTDVELVNLQAVGGDLNIHDIPGITTLTAMRSLETVGGDLRLHNLAALSQVSFGTLESVGGDVLLTEAPELGEVTLAALSQAGGLQLGELGGNTWHWGLKTLGLDALATVDGDVTLAGLGSLGVVEAPALTSVGGALQLEGACAASLSFPLLTEAGSLMVSGLCSLEDLTGLAALTALSDETAEPVLHIDYSDGLDQATLEAFAATLQLPEGAEVTLSGSEEGSCDTKLLLTYGRSEDDACTEDTGA